jgi:hypothetical protein
VNGSRNRLIRENRPFDVTLFTIDDQQRRRFVATIRSAECLNDSQADIIEKHFKEQGWFEMMRAEIGVAKGIAAALGTDPRAKHFVNVRFRAENVAQFPPDTFAAKDEPVFALNRYTLASLLSVDRKHREKAGQMRTGDPNPPEQQSYFRRATAAVIVTPEHALMQAKLVRELRAEFPHAQILCEEDFVDVSVRTQNELILFEIKSDQAARSVIRQALGQILEYAYHPRRQHALPLRLIIVGRTSPSPDDSVYLGHLKTTFNLPIEYRTVAL